MTDENAVQLVNRGGKIVGVDPDSGDEVPIELGSALGSDDEPIPDQSHFESVSTEQAVIDRNESIVRGEVDLQTNHHAVADDGTWFAIEGSEVYRSENVIEGFEQVGTFPISVTTRNSDLHITAQGTLLASGDGNIYRSTDDGQSWTDVHTLNVLDNRIWTFSEDTSGKIIASEYQTGVTLWESTDDGSSWSVLADENDLPAEDHIHKAKFHPADDDRIIITMGDGDSVPIYRSDDGGDNWDAIDPLEMEDSDRTDLFVGVCGHPTDPEVYFLGTDSSRLEGIYKVRDDGSNVEVEHIQTVTTTATDSGTTGSVFTIRCVETPHGHYFVASSRNDQNVHGNNEGEEMVWASISAEGTRWRALQPTPTEWSSVVSSQGAAGAVLNTDVNPYLISDGQILSLHDLGNPIYGFHRNNYFPGQDTQMFRGDSGIWLNDLHLRGRKADGNLLIRGADGTDYVRINPGGFVRFGEGGEQIQPRGGVQLQEGDLLYWDDYYIRQDGDVLVIQDENIDTIAEIDQDGNMDIAGELNENATF